MLDIDKAVIVEGKYDKIRLSSVINGVVICTDGFGIFRDRDKLQIIRHYARTTGIIILTDSDTAGFRIRNFLRGAVGGDNITNVYIPDIFGKERRKTAPSREGKLGVKGMDEKTLTDAFARAGVIPGGGGAKRGGISKMLLYEYGLSGGPDASEKRRTLLKSLDLPQRMTTNALVDILNTMMSDRELIALLESLSGEKRELRG